MSNEIMKNGDILLYQNDVEKEVVNVVFPGAKRNYREILGSSKRGQKNRKQNDRPLRS